MVITYFVTVFQTLAESLQLEGKSCVSFVGAGGKTSLIRRIAVELFESHRNIAVTTTTRIAPYDVDELWHVVKPNEHDKNCLRLIGEAGEKSKIPFFYSEILSDGKLKGLRFNHVEQIYQCVEHLIIESDGASGTSFKIPRKNEPQVPPFATHICIVMGLDVFEKPACSGLIFKFRELKEKLNLSMQEDKPPQPSLLRDILFGTHHNYNSYLQIKKLHNMKAILIINKADSASSVEKAREIANLFYHPDIDRIVISNSIPYRPVVVANNDRDKIAGVVLAAGCSERFKGNKLCSEIDGEPMITRIVSNALESMLDLICVVTGHKAREVLQCLDLLKEHTAVMTIENKNYKEGIGSSIREGIHAISSWADAAMIILGDMPAIDYKLIDSVIQAYKNSNAKICYPVTGGRSCHPVVFRKDMFDQLTKLKGEEGGKALIEKNRQWAKEIHLTSLISQFDVDTPQDLEKAREIIKK